MKNSFAKQTMVAVLALLLVGAVVGFTETQKLEVKVKKGETETIELNMNGTVETIELEDLAEGEERHFNAGEHTVKVRREGDELHVSLDGEDIHGIKVQAKHGSSNMVWVGEGGADEISVLSSGELKGKRVIMVSGEGEADGHKVIKIKCESDDGDTVDCEELEAIDIETIISDQLGVDGLLEKKHLDGTPMMVTHHVMANDAATLRFRCSDDETQLVIPKAKATQDRYLCPVCGREMEKVETPEMKIMTFVQEAEKSEGCED